MQKFFFMVFNKIYTFKKGFKMIITKTGLPINPVRNVGTSKTRNFTPALNEDIHDTVSFSSNIKEKYDDIKTQSSQTNRNTLNSQRRYLISSQMENIVKDAEDFTDKHNEYDTDDIISDLILIAAEQADKYIINYNEAKEQYFEKLLNIPEIDNLNEKIESKERVADVVSAKILKENVDKSLETLNPKQAKIIVRLYGLDGSEPRSKEEVAKMFGESISTIDNTRIKALEELRKTFNKNGFEV